MPILLQEAVNQLSTDSWASLLKVRIGQAPTKANVVVINSHGSNTIQYRILYSNDPEGASGTWSIKTAATDVSPYDDDPANAKVTDINPCPLWIDVQIKTKTGTSHGTGNAWLKAAGM